MAGRGERIALRRNKLTNARVVDLFCGVGGLSLGAARAGYHVAMAVDIDPHALTAHAANFPATLHLAETAERLSGKRIRQLLGGEPPDGLIGGPPCQGFSVIGPRNARDPRNDLFRHFCRLVAEVGPSFFVAENVPGILHPRNRRLVEAALAPLRRRWRLLLPLRLVASDFGAPTSRERVFFVGILRGNAGPRPGDFASAACRPTTVAEALRGLPRRIAPRWQSAEDGWRPLVDRPRGEFGRMARGRVPTGVGSCVALRRLRRERVVSGCHGTVHSPSVLRRFRALRPGMRDSVSRIPRLDPDGLCPALRAGTDALHGSHQALRPLHPYENRVITPREAARLQGFPDWFVFTDAKWHAFRQIGGSVSPIVAEALLRVLRRYVR